MWKLISYPEKDHNSEPKFKLDAIYGSVEIKTFYKPENNRIACYCYSIRYDRDGKEISRTAPEKLSEIY